MKIIRRLTFAFISMLAFNFSTKAQVNNTRDSLIKAYEQGSIMLQNSRYIINGESYKMGFGKRKIGETLKSSTMAYTEFELFKKSQNRFNVLNAVGLGAAIASVFFVNQNTDQGLYVGLTVVSLGCLVVSIPLQGKSTKHFKKAVWLYNRDVLKN